MVNDFSSTFAQKVIYGHQQLYLIGSTDVLNFELIMPVFLKYFPTILYRKLKRYIYSNSPRCTIRWEYFKEKLEKIDFKQCGAELKHVLHTNRHVSENNVKIFHISENHLAFKSTEPTIENTANMIYRWLTFCYQRNIVASLIKYILLYPTLQQLNQVSDNPKGIFGTIKKRLTEIIFECHLLSFNGSNYDNYLLGNSLINIQSKRNEKIKIFKKGSAISTIILPCKQNFTCLRNITSSSHIEKKERCKKNRPINTWPINFYFKDLRNLLAPNMSLDKTAQLFNLEISKLCFPYNMATSVECLKQMHDLNPYNDQFWTDTFSSKLISLEQRLIAQQVFDEKKCTDMYSFSCHYLKLDCLLLHNIFLVMFNSYLTSKIDLVLRRNYSQSNLSFQQFFVVEPSRQIDSTMAPKKIQHPIYNYLIKSSVAGGLCQSLVHGQIDQSTTIINDHFNYLDYPSLCTKIWPNFANLRSTWKKGLFQTKPSNIVTLDIRSLYPSAAVKKLPVGTPFFYSRLTPADFEHITTTSEPSTVFNLNTYCSNVRSQGNLNHDMFKLLKGKPVFLSEFHVLNYYLSQLNIDKNSILRFQSNYTALGQLFLDEYPVDGFLAYTENNTLYLKIIQYNSNYYHGHRSTCSVKNSDKNQVHYDKTQNIKKAIECLLNRYKSIFELENLEFEIVELYDCDFFCHKIPAPPVMFKSHFTYNEFLNNIYSNKLEGFLVVKSLELKKNAQNPMFGFIVQKCEYSLKDLSPYTQSLLKKFSSFARVVSLHKSSDFFILSTHYFNWLGKTFGFECTPDIYHALFFRMDKYLKVNIEKKLLLRKNLKNQIKNEKDITIRQKLECQSELVKLLLNSCYGFCLCNTNSGKFKTFENRREATRKSYRSKFNSCLKINTNTYLVECKKQIESPFQTLLGHVGSSILFNSKIILLKRVYFLLKHLNPCKAQALYMDTDSLHLCLQHENLLDNIDLNLQSSFIANIPKHFDSGPKLSGVWVIENIFKWGNYIGEKCYILKKNDQEYLTHMKGLNTSFQNKFVENQIDISKTSCINYHIFFKSPDFTLFKTFMSKDLFSNYLPVKRYFVFHGGSFPLQLN